MSCKIDHNDYKNNGLITKIWGGPGWIFNHSVTFGFPLEPTPEQKEIYKNYFTLLGDVLPCKYCRDSYKKFITEGNTILNDDVLQNRHTLTKWFYDLHEKVNDKLEMDYATSYQEVVDKYESFRAKCGIPNPKERGCLTPLDYKAFSFKSLYYIEAPIIQLDTIMPLVEIARIRGLGKMYFEFIELAKLLNGDFVKLKKQKCWYYRNKFCQNQIKYMRINAIPSLEQNDFWKDTPTMDELKLIMFLSSNLNKSEINQILTLIQSKPFLDKLKLL